MNVDNYSRFQPRQHFQKKYRYVAVFKDPMGIVDKQNIACLKLIKQRRVNVFKRYADHVGDGVKAAAPRG